MYKIIHTYYDGACGWLSIDTTNRNLSLKQAQEKLLKLEKEGYRIDQSKIGYSGGWFFEFTKESN